MGIVELSRAAFTTFQLKGEAYQWWRAYELEFDQLRQGAMFVSEYAVKFSELSRHTPALDSIVRERVYRFIKGLNHGIRISMARELETDTPYQQVVEIARRLEGMRGRYREAKRLRNSRTYSGSHATVAACHGRGYVIHPVHLVLPTSNGILATLRSQVAHYAPPLSNAPSAQGAFSGQSKRLGPSQLQQPCPPRACFECGDTRHMGPQASQAVVTTPVATPLAQPSRGGGREGRGCPIEGGQARCYALPTRTEAIASDSVITYIVSVCRRDASVLSSFTYSYVSYYFDPYLGISHDFLSSPIYVSMLVGGSIIVDRVYRSCLVVLGGFETRGDLLLLSIVDFDVILGMDWFSPYHVILGCHAKTVMLAMPGFPRLEWMGTLDYVLSRVVSFLKAHRMVGKGCDAYLAFVRDVSVYTPTVKLVPVVRDYPNVFLGDLPGMLPIRDIDFGFVMFPGTQPISIPPYRMVPTELKELKEQLQEFIDKDFIRPMCHLGVLHSCL
ncbi:uncharacterized protein [Nicotiana tomentosiformis]|uniref:uncharacterized protein n=1 Tax=Nicotiana tomentosiformis TaxID=4098 RepID=UPI00388C5CFD